MADILPRMEAVYLALLVAAFLIVAVAAVVVLARLFTEK
jgi:hypothetical protein